MGLQEKIDIASGRVKAQKVFKNAQIINVFTNEIYKGDVAVNDGVILAIGEYDGEEEIDLSGRFLSPSLFDGHVHIESSMVSPGQFAKAVLLHGVTTAICDPHEIANVKGTEGIDYMLEATEGLPLTAYMMLPSCVPSTDFESAGAVLEAEDLVKYIDHPRVLGLGEMMNFPGVYMADPAVLEKLSAFEGLPIDGHGPLISGKELATYAVAGIKTEHECSSSEELLERVRLGMYVQLREGTGAKNVVALLEGINKDTIQRCFFCTDDRHPHSLLEEGSIDNNIRVAIQGGLDPIDAIKLGAYYGPMAYNLKGIGAIAPTYRADFLVLSDLESFEIESVYVGGEVVVDRGELLAQIQDVGMERVQNSVHIHEVQREDLAVPAVDGKFVAIEIIPESLLTRRLDVDANGEEVFAYSGGLKKLVVVERHRGIKSLSAAAVHGFGDLKGAIALTIAHDSHNVIVIGSSDDEILHAIEEMKRLQGGIVLVQRGEVLGRLPLEIGGLMSIRDLHEVQANVHDLMNICYEDMGVNPAIDPFVTLSFMALPVIPSIKLTDQGLFDVDAFRFIYGGKN